MTDYTNLPNVPDRSDPDFTLAGTALLEWLGHEPHEASIKAAEQALAVPGEAFIVAVFHDPALPAGKFAEVQRRALRVWFRRNHPDRPGRVRLNLRSRLEPSTGQDVKVAVVTYDREVKPRKATTTDG